MIKATPKAITKWITPPDDSSADEDIISYCARVSNPSNQENFKTAGKLLKYCIEHKHWSVFEMSNIVIEIEAPRDITRQLLRHRQFCFQEFSQRYADPTKVFDDVGFRETRLQDTKNRQNSVQTDDEQLRIEWETQQDIVKRTTSRVYKWAIDKGIAKELARVVLPEGLTMTRIYVNGNLRTWFHYCQVRKERGITQSEHCDIADLVWEILVEQYPFLAEIDITEIPEPEPEPEPKRKPFLELIKYPRWFT